MSAAFAAYGVYKGIDWCPCDRAHHDCGQLPPVCPFLPGGALATAVHLRPALVPVAQAARLDSQCSIFLAVDLAYEILAVAGTRWPGHSVCREWLLVQHEEGTKRSHIPEHDNAVHLSTWHSHEHRLTGLLHLSHPQLAEELAAGGSAQTGGSAQPTGLSAALWLLWQIWLVLQELRCVRV